MYQLYIANKNYSSWSLRPWVLMRERGIAFEEQRLRFGDNARWREYRAISPNGRVPCLVDGDMHIWDSLAITEYLAERHGGIWPQDAKARAYARCAAAEMHSSFSELRNRCTMSCGQRARVRTMTAALTQDVSRIGELWSEGLRRFGGPFLGGRVFTAIDAFFAPVAFRVQTYALTLPPAAAEYAARLLALPSMQRWYQEALAETFRDQPHEQDMRQMAEVTEDLRAN